MQDQCVISCVSVPHILAVATHDSQNMRIICMCTPPGCNNTHCIHSVSHPTPAGVQERDKLTIAAEGATRMRIKNQEVLDKEEQIRALLAANRTKLEHLLSLRGKGEPPISLAHLTQIPEFCSNGCVGLQE